MAGERTSARATESAPRCRVGRCRVRNFGTWAERLEAVAAGREIVAVAGRRDAIGVSTSSVHVFAKSQKQMTAWSFDAGAAVTAIAFAGDALLLSGGDDGRLIAWDVTGQ